MLTAQVTDDAGAVVTEAFSITLNGVNDAPEVAPPAAVTVDEDATRDITLAMLGYSDAEDDALVSVTITVLPASGTLLLDGVAVTAPQMVTLAQLNAGDLDL